VSGSVLSVTWFCDARRSLLLGLSAAFNFSGRASDNIMGLATAAAIRKMCRTRGLDINTVLTTVVLPC
jgi:hypothetical protein